MLHYEKQKGMQIYPMHTDMILHLHLQFGPAIQYFHNCTFSLNLLLAVRLLQLEYGKVF